jgi:RHS repeat-associated protein
VYVGGVLDHYVAQVVQAQDYTAFGAAMEGRSFSISAYRFGFNGKENDTDWGPQLIQDYGFRLYNPALGRFLTVDPLSRKFPMLTPYQFASNNPVWMIDIDGLEGTTYDQWKRLTTDEKILIVKYPYVVNDLKRNRALAFQKTEELFTGTDSEGTGFLNDEADAFRHAFFNALNAQSFGKEIAKELGKAHENLDNPQEIRQNQRKMDLHNNAVGQDIGEANPDATADELVKMVEEERKSGGLVVLKDPTDETGNTPLVPSNNQDSTVILKDNVGTLTPRLPTPQGADNTRVVIPPSSVPEQVKKQ